MSDSSYDVDEILKQVRKRREENEARIKAQAAESAAQPAAIKNTNAHVSTSR